jgi:hypothetical protein
MAAIRWHEDAHLFAIAVIAFSLGLYGYRARRRHRPGWAPHHAIGMGGSYIALLTGFYLAGLSARSPGLRPPASERCLRDRGATGFPQLRAVHATCRPFCLNQDASLAGAAG